METGPSELSNSRGPVHDLQKSTEFGAIALEIAFTETPSCAIGTGVKRAIEGAGRRSATLPIYSLRGVATWEKVIAAPWLASFRSAAFAQMLLAYTSLCLLRGSPSFV